MEAAKQLEVLNKEAQALSIKLDNARQALLQTPGDETLRTVYNDLKAEKAQLDTMRQALVDKLPGVHEM